jgi:hypothetical protein
MDILIFLVLIVAVGALIYFNRSSRSLDINNDGKLDLSDAALAVKNTVQETQRLADVDGDGKVTVNDAKVLATKAKSTVKKAASKAKTQVKAATKRRSK